MTADIRTAAQREVRKPASEGNPIAQFGVTTDIAFVRGAVWSAARVTPTREQIAERMRAHYFKECAWDSGERYNWWIAKCSCGWESAEVEYPGEAHDAYYAHASRQVAALMQELTEGGSGEQTH